jgi:signal transduction histidine kinase/ActR/RegA family two-component response regulator
MKAYRDLPIRQKLLVLTLASSASALTLATLGFLAWDVSYFRAEIRRDVDAQATIVAANSTAPLAFMDNRAAGETLSVLRLRPRVAMACLYARDGSLFATYHRTADAACPAQPPARAVFDADTYDALTPVMMGGERLGTLYISRDMNDLYDRLRVGLIAVAGLLAVMAALLIARRLQRVIATPLLHLADTARAISSGRDYTLRATAHSQDEIGVVVYAFNNMLDRLAERNSELSRANADLAHEVEERRRVEVERTQALERERDANRLKDEFLATLSHELRTPLNAVLGWARMLRSAPVEPQVRARALESIERNAHAQARLIEDLLEISRIVTGKLRIQVQQVDLATIVDAAVDVVQPAAAARRIRMTAEIAVRPAFTSGDPDRLQQVVWNLLSNAVKFTPEGGAVAVRLEGGAGYRIRVTDNGQGIDTRFLPHVFEPFRQADGTTSREHGGLGLGLAIARQLVELHGGTISADSEGRGKGATFEVYLPSALAAPRAPASPQRDAPQPAPAIDSTLLKGVSVLIVDDEDDARLLLETTLKHYGADVMSADRASRAIELIEQRCPDVLLSDIGMPGEDGYRLIRRVRALASSRCAVVPAVAITAYASERDYQNAIEAGYQEHVAKPFDPDRLVTIVARLAGSTRSTNVA